MLNCPVLCDFCKCIDNKIRFEVAQLNAGITMLKSCEWAERQDTETRCNKFPEVKGNCPLLCGECKNDDDNSNAPSVAPCEGLCPVTVVVVITTTSTRVALV